MKNESHLTTKEGSIFLSLSQKRVQEMCTQKKKHFPNAIKKGKMFLIPLSDLEAVKQARNALNQKKSRR